MLMGDRFGDSVRLYRAISQQPPDEMARSVATYRAEGYTRFQLKVGGDPDPDIERIWQREPSSMRPTAWWRMPTRAGRNMRQMRVERAVRDLDVYIEQPA